MTNIETEYGTDNRVRTSPLSMADDTYDTSPSTYHNKYRVIDRNAPAFEGRDIVAAVLASTMMLSPLAAYALGMGA